MGEDHFLTATTSFEDDTEVLNHTRGTAPSEKFGPNLISDSSRYILDNQDTIALIACLDSGKTKIDASLGEILVTVEKLKWTIEHGEKALQPQRRPTSFLMMYKRNQVRWEPLGVLAACVSWK
jgi:acyl-CoA reductase-like NAD-dependent aldehyde dehydrogenase